MSDVSRGGSVPPALPQRGTFATSEVLPLIQRATGEVTRLREEWRALRDAAAEAKSLAKVTRANLIVNLRVWGNEGTGGIAIKTSAERNEWADADPEVQRTELAADLAQTAAMNARAAYDTAEEYFQSLRSMLAMERDDNKREWPGGG